MLVSRQGIEITFAGWVSDGDGDEDEADFPTSSTIEWFTIVNGIMVDCCFVYIVNKLPLMLYKTQ